MPTSASDQLALVSTPGNHYVEGNRDVNAKIRIDYFSVLVAAGFNGIADTLELVSLPKGARILDGNLVGPANTASSTLALGTSHDLVGGSGDAVTIAAGPANLLAAASTAAAYNLPFANTFALGAGFKTTARTKVVATIGGAALTVGSQVTGWIKYTVN